MLASDSYPSVGRPFPSATWSSHSSQPSHALQIRRLEWIRHHDAGQAWKAYYESDMRFKGASGEIVHTSQERIQPLVAT
jgi:hypothetical protein